MDSEDMFSVENHLEIGPSEQYSVFLDGGWFGRLVLNQLYPSEERGFAGFGLLQRFEGDANTPHVGVPALPDRPS